MFVAGAALPQERGSGSGSGAALHLMTEKGTNVKPLVPNRKGGKTHELVQLMEQKSLLYNLCVHTDVLLLSMI